MPGKHTPSLTVQAFWFAAAKTVAFGLSVVLPLVLVRLLSRFEFGLYKQAFLVPLTAYHLLHLGVSLSAFYYFPRMPERRAQIVFNIMLFNTITGALAAAAFILYPRVVVLFVGSDDLLPYATQIGIIVFLWLFASFLETVAAAEQAVKMSTIFIVSAQLSKLLLMLGATLLFASIGALLWASVLQGILQSVVLVGYLSTRFPGFWRKRDFHLLWEQFRYAAPLSLAGVIYSLRTDLPGYFVAHQFNPSIYAIYAVGTTQLPLIGILRQSIGAVLLPRISGLQHQQKHDEVLRVTARAMRKLAAVYLPIFFFLLIARQEFTVFFYGRQYAESVPIFAIFLLMVPINLLVVDPIMRAYAEMQFYLVGLSVLLLVGLVPLLYFGIKHFGLIGTVIAVVVTFALERLLIALRVARLLKLNQASLRLFADVGKCGAAAAVAAGVGAAVRSLLLPASPLLILLVCGTVYCAAYFAGIVLLRVPATHEYKAVQRMIARIRGILTRRSRTTASTSA